MHEAFDATVSVQKNSLAGGRLSQDTLMQQAISCENNLQEYGKQTQYRRASLVVLAALEDLDQASKSKAMVFPWYMRDNSMGYFAQEHRARQISTHVINSYWYRWLSMGVIVISIIAVIWTPNSSQTGPDSKVIPSKSLLMSAFMFGHVFVPLLVGC